MKLASVVLLSSALAFLACSDDSSSTSASSKGGYDCSTSSGVVVAYPAGGESFKLGDTITVVYGADPSLAGPLFIFRYRANNDDMGTELTEESTGEAKPDGKTCYEQKVWLDPDLLDTSDEAFIQVVPYSKTSKNGKSGKFTVTE